MDAEPPRASSSTIPAADQPEARPSDAPFQNPTPDPTSPSPGPPSSAAEQPRPDPGPRRPDPWHTAAWWLVALWAGASIIVIRRGRLHRPLDPLRRAAAADGPAARIPDWPVILLGAMVVLLAQIIGARSSVMLLNMPADASSTLRGSGLISLGGYAGALLGVVFVCAVLPGMPARIGLARAGRTPLAQALAGLGAFVLCMPIVMGVGWLASVAAALLGRAPSDGVAHKVLALLREPGGPTGPEAHWWWLTVAGVTIGAPIVEEVVYRGFLQSALRRAFRSEAPAPTPSRDAVARIAPAPVRPAWTAILLTSAVFTAMHAGVAEPHALPTLMALSVCFGVLRERTGGLLAPIVMHAAFNAFNIALALAAAP